MRWLGTGYGVQMANVCIGVRRAHSGAHPRGPKCLLGRLLLDVSFRSQRVRLARVRARAAFAALATCMMVVLAGGCGDAGTGDVASSSPPPGVGQVADGKEIFTQNCAGCHTLADAGTTGVVGPNLDQSKPPKALVVERVTNGIGAMPSFTDRFAGGPYLTKAQIQGLADYVTSAAGK
jgi:mono/diheme cytochrome c family protein